MIHEENASRGIVLIVAVSRLEAACASHDGHALLYRHVAARLKELCYTVRLCASDKGRASVAEDIRSTVKDVQQVLQLGKFPLRWITDSQRTVVHAHKTHERIDALYGALGVREDARVGDWHIALRRDRLQHECWLEERPELSTDAMLFNDTPSKMERWDALVTLRSQRKAWPMDRLGDSLVAMSTEAKLSRELADLLERTTDREPNEQVHSWYVPQSDVKLKDGDGAEKFNRGAFDQLCKATWMNEWEQKKVPVVIKHFFKLEMLNDSPRLLRTLETWSKLRHENVLEMLGANHLAHTKFYIAENSTEGNFSDFFYRNENKKLLWDLSKQAAEGLQYLHDNRVEHGNLSMENILITQEGSGESAKFVVKLSDFGMGFVRVEAVSISVRRTEIVRPHWVSPERITASSPSNDLSPHSDTYSLGMCIWAAASGELPYGVDDEETIIEKKLEHVPTDRPDGAFTDAEWHLVSSMVDINPENRPSLEEAIQRMGELDVVRQRDWPFKEEPTRAF